MDFQKIIVASDLHYGLGKNSKKKLSILKDCVEPAIIDELKDSSGKNFLFVICGDLFHEMVSVRTDIYKEARTFIENCANFSKVIILAGNHDCFDDNTDITSIELFDQLEGVDVIRFPEERTYNGKKFLFLPWSDDNESAFRFKDGEYDAVFCHPDVPGEFFTGIYVSENGRKMSVTEKNKRLLMKNKLVNSGLDKMDFSDGSENNKIVSGLDSVRKVITLAKEGGTIFAGHIHKHSESSILGRKFFFVGAPYQTTSEEINTKSGIYRITNDKTSFVEIHSPEYVKIKFSDVKKTGIENYDFSKVTGNIVQYDGDDVISVELEAKIKRSVIENSPFEITETDYSNLVLEPNKPENIEKYQKAFSTSPKKCVDLYIKNIDDEIFQTEKVSKKKIAETFDALYDFTDRKLGSINSEGGANVNYKKMIATNFLSYDTLEFDFLKYNGLTLIYGKNLDNPGATNACGKSNIIKAIVYSLFGRFPKKVKKENMSQWDAPVKNVDVTIFLESNGVNYRIESGMTKKSREAYHRVFNEDTNTELTKKQLSETRKFIETEILHCGFDMFMKTTVLTSSEIFNFYCMKKEDKDDYLNTIFGTKTLNEVREQIKQYLKDNRTVYLEYSRLLESKEHDIELNRNASERFEANRRLNIEEIKNEIASLEVKISEIFESEKSEKNEETIRLENELKEVNSSIKDLNLKIKKVKSEIAEATRSIEKDTSTMKIMATELEKHKDVVPKLCDDCKKIVSEGYKLTDYTKSIKSSRENVKKNKTLLSELEKSLDRLDSELNPMVRKSIKLDNDIRNSRSSSAESSRIESIITSKKSTMEYIEKQENPNVKIIESLETEKDELSKKTDEILSKIRCLDFIQSKVVSQEVITNLLTSKFIKQLNDRIRYYLQRLGLNLGVEFDDDFHYEFDRGNGAHPEFNSLSGGESLRIVIATSFAFKDFLESRRNISSNIRFLDEFFEKDTDNLGMNNTISILKDFSKMMNQNVFLISNKLNEIDDSAFDNILVVTIENSKSRIEEDDK